MKDSKAAAAFNNELIVKICHLKKRIDAMADELDTKFAELTPQTLIDQVTQSPAQTLELFKPHPDLAVWLSNLTQQKNYGSLLISEHEDHIISVERGYGAGNEKPENYLNRFNQWIMDHKTSHGALKILFSIDR